MTHNSGHRVSDESIRVSGTIVGLGIIGLGFFLSLTVGPGPVEESWFWRTASTTLPFLGPGLLVLAITARIIGASRAWVLPVTAALVIAFLALAVHAADVATISGRFDTGIWGFLYVAGLSASSLGLLFVLGSGERKAAYVGLLIAPFIALSGVALSLHEAAENPFWSDTWVFLGQVNSPLCSAFVLTAACLVVLHLIPHHQLRVAGVLAATAALIAGAAYGWWFMDRVPQDQGWLLSLEWTRAVSLGVFILVATDVIRRFELLAILAVGLVVASVVHAGWWANRAEADHVQAFLVIALSFLTPVALIVFWWLLNDREREPDEAPSETPPPRLDSLGYSHVGDGAG